MKHKGRGVIRINDRTDHGGKVIGASSGTVVMGKLAALDGDLTFCPKCKGNFAIKTDKAGAKHEGRHYAYHGDVTACGAHLISSLFPDTSDGLVQDDAAIPESATAGTSAEADGRHTERVVLVDGETREPLGGSPYQVERERGAGAAAGTTNSDGKTEALG